MNTARSNTRGQRRSPCHLAHEVAATLAFWALGLLALQPSDAKAAACHAASGKDTAALIELYTSEGCSSCPPADAQLRQLNQALDPGANAIGLAMHVTYWDGIGWKDPFAHPAFDARHAWLVQANRHNAVFTPHFFVSGTEARTWPRDLATQVRRVNARKAAAKLNLQVDTRSDGVLAMKAEIALAAPMPRAALYLAVTESGLVSKVKRGENAGTTLTHDHVVRAWLGPFPVRGSGEALRQEARLDASWSRAKLSVVAFVQDTASGEVIQAVRANGCALP